MAIYTPQKKSAADLLTLVQKIDASATAVDASTGAVTSPTVWGAKENEVWLNWWASYRTCEIVVT